MINMTEFIKEKTLMISVIVGSVIMFLITLFILFATIRSVDVLKDWSLNTNKPSYVEGETIEVNSRVNKLIDVKGESRRFIYCTYDNRETGYEVSVKGVNSSVGKNSSIIITAAPMGVRPLPQSCYLLVQIRYSLPMSYGFRVHTEENRSNTFNITSKE